jgi:hypothetical protein
MNCCDRCKKENVGFTIFYNKKDYEWADMLEKLTHLDFIGIEEAKKCYRNKEMMLCSDCYTEYLGLFMLTKEDMDNGIFDANDKPSMKKLKERSSKMIDIKPPEEEVKRKTELREFEDFLASMGIMVDQQGDELWIDAAYADGKDGFIIKFSERGSFQEFDYIGLIPENVQAKELHEINITLKAILTEMRKRRL